jgi:transposase
MDKRTAKQEGIVVVAGIDLAKNVFGVHGVDQRGEPVLRRRLRRDQLLAEFANRPPCLIGLEACSGAHYWARELAKLGHTARIMAPEFVKPFRKSRHSKNDANDAEAIAIAVQQRNMRFVPVKSVDQQAVLVPHRVRQGFLAERTAAINRLRGLLSEFGLVLPQSVAKLRRGLAPWLAPDEQGLPEPMKACAIELLEHLDVLEARIARYERLILEQARASEPARRAMTLRGIGPITAAAAQATVTVPTAFKNGRQFAAWLGMVPKQHSSGDKVLLGAITRRGDTYLRTLLIQGARSALQAARNRAPDRHDRLSSWIVQLYARVGYHKALVGIANKHARILWAILVKGESFNPALPNVHRA